MVPRAAKGWGWTGGTRATCGMQGFSHIQAWQRAHALSVALHKLSTGFRRAGHSHLRSQLTRAADSIAANIVEGCGSATQREFARFLDISVKSATETEHHLLVARDLGLLPPVVWSKLAAETVEIRKMIYSYRKKLLHNHGTSGTSHV
jgi:four helix bundle protein